MNIKSAFGFPTPNTVCVREQARCPHFVQAPTRSRTALSSSALFGAPGSPLGTGDSTASTDVVCAGLSAIGAARAAGTASNRASAVLDAHGARSPFSRILSSVAMTKSRAGCVMCDDHPKFRAQLQTISVKHTRACNFWIADWGWTRSSPAKTATTPNFSGGQNYLKHASVLPTSRLIQQFRFDVECRFDVHLRARIRGCRDWLLGGRWPLIEIPRSNFHRWFRGGGCVYFASPARRPGSGAITPNGK